MKKLIYIIFTLMFCLTGVGQTTQKADSLLELSYENYSYYNLDEAIHHANMAAEIAEQLVDTARLTKAHFYAEIAYQVKHGDQYDITKIIAYRDAFSKLGLRREEAQAYLHMARIYYYFGDVKNEIKQYFKALDIYTELNFSSGISAVHSDLSLMYYDQHDYELAFKNIRKAISIDQVEGDFKRLHRDYNNLAIIFEHTLPLDSAVYYHLIALDYARKSKDAFSVGISLSNLGNNYALMGQYELAEKTLKKALSIRDSIGNYKGLAYTHNRLANLYIQTNQIRLANYHAEQSLFYAEKASQLKVKRMAYDRLLEIARLKGDESAELKYLKASVELVDSLRNSDNTKQITKNMMRYEFEKQQLADSVTNYANQIKLKSEYDQKLLKERNTRNIAVISGVFFLLLALGLYQRAQYIKKTKKVLQAEKERSDELLLNILPAEVAEELKTTGTSEARDFENVTVLFTDFKAFTQTAELLTAKQLVSEINHCFKAFDAIIEEFGVEKIKTIGDAYMAAGGLHVPRNAEPADVVRAALKMQEFMKNRAAERLYNELPAFEMRVGIHTGPVVAGIVGVKKFQYDIWGDTVNTANRMETNGAVGKVNISQATYELLKNDPDFAFESRGKIEAKGKGEMEMWFVKRTIRKKSS